MRPARIELATSASAGHADRSGSFDAEFVRLAVTPDQVDGYDLPDDPTSPGSVQAEAIRPDVMAAILDEAITSRLDPDAGADVLAKEEEQRPGSGANSTADATGEVRRPST